MANQDFRVKNGLQVGLGASVVGIVTAESFSGSAVGLTSVPSASLTGTISTERLLGTYNIDITGTVSGDSINVGTGNTGVFANSDGTLLVTGIATFKDRVIFDSTNSIQVPVGTEAEKDAVGTAVTGQIRYNTTNSQFEGFGPGNDWGSLGGVKDVDGDTYVKPESSPGSDEDALTFFTGGTERAVIDSNGKVGIATTNPTATLDLDGTLNVSGISTFSDDLIVGTATTGVVARTDGTLNVSGISTFLGNVGINTSAGNSYLNFPIGNNITTADIIHAGAGIGDYTLYTLKSSNQHYIRQYTSGYYNVSVGGPNAFVISNTDSFNSASDNPAGVEDADISFVVNPESSTELRYNYNKKFETTGYGVSVYGGLDVSGISTFQNNVEIHSTGYLQIPVGLSTDRPTGTGVTLGQIRYNSELSQFEGYGAGNAWGSLGGIKDVDQDTYITAESSAGADEDALTFFTGGTERVVIDSNGKVGIGSTQPTSTLDVDGTLSVSGVATFSANVDIDDDQRLRFGAGNDLQIYHLSSNNNSVIQETGSGDLNILGNNVNIRNQAGNENIARFIQDGAVKLYYDNVTKFETTTDGFKVQNGTSETAVISGPQNIIVDPSPDDVVAIATGNISGANVSTITGITTTDIAVGNLIQEVDGIISTGTTVTSVGVDQVGISKTSLGSASAEEFTFVNQTPTGIVRIKGDLYIDGTRTEINSTTLTVDDLNVVVASGATNGLTADGAGLTVDGADAYLKYNYNAGTNETWELNKNVGIGTDNATSTLDVDGTLNVSGISTFQDDVNFELYGTGNYIRVDRSDRSLMLSDNTTLKFGTSPDDGGTTKFTIKAQTHTLPALNNTYLENHEQGDIFIRNTVNDQDIIIQSDNGGSGSVVDYFRADGSTGEAMLYHYGTEKLATKSTGIDVTGRVETDTLNVSGISTFSDDLTVGTATTGVVARNDGTLNVTGVSTFLGDVNIGIGGTTAFFDVSSGKVGIGSTQPLVALDVAGAIRQELHTPAMPVGLNDDIGTNWDRVSFEVPGENLDVVNALAYCGDGIVLAGTGGYYGDVFRSTDYGKTWIKTPTGVPTPGAEINSLAYCGNGIALAGSGYSNAGDGDIYRSTDYGQTWTKIYDSTTLKNILSLVYCGDGIVLAGSGSDTGDGDVYRSTDFGLTWTKIEMGADLERIYSLCYLGNGIVLAGSGSNTGDGDVYRSTDFGLTWTKIEMGADLERILSFAYCENGIVLAGAGAGSGDGDVYRSTDFGQNWTKIEMGATYDSILSLAYCDNGIVLAGSGSQTGDADIFKSTDYGKTWTNVTDGSYQEFVSEVNTAFQTIESLLYCGNGIALAGGGNTLLKGDVFRSDVGFSQASTMQSIHHQNVTGNIGINSTSPTATLDINGTLNVSGVSTFHDNIWIPDNNAIYHTAAALGGFPVRAILNSTQTNWLYREYLKTTAGVGKSTYVSSPVSGVDYEISVGSADNFYIGDNSIIPFNDYPTNISFEVDIDGATSLYYNHNKKLETIGYGVSVTGGLNVSGIVTARSFVGSGELLTNLDAYAAYTSDRSTLATIADKISGIATYSEDQGFNYLGGNESYHGNSFFYGVDIEASDDGKVMFVSSIPNSTGNQAGCGVQIYERTNSNFNYVGFVTSLSHHTLGAGQTVGDLGTWFGPTLASNADASIFAVGSPNVVSNPSGSDNQYGWWDAMNGWEGRHGCVNIFQKTGNNIEPLGILTAPDSKSSDASQFGQALAFSSDGTKLYVSAVGIETTAYGVLGNGTSQHGLVYAYNKVGTSYQQVGVLTSYRPNDITFPGTWGHRVVCSDDGDTIYISGPSENATSSYDREGLVEVYSRTGNTFTHVGILTCMHDPNVDLIWNNADFGISMDCSSDGNIIAIAANPQYNATQTPQGGYGALFVFEKTGTNTFSKIAEEIFDANTVGTNVTLEIGKYDLRVNSDASVIVMSASEVTNAGSDPGGHFVAFSRDGGNISKIGAFTPLTPQPSGASFDFMMFGNSLAIDSTGDNIFVGAPVHPLGNTTNSLADKGSAYVFNITRQIALHSNQITGNIGIGTDNPTSSLDVNGTLNVSGITTIGGLLHAYNPTVSTTGVTTHLKVQDGNVYWAVEFEGNASNNTRIPYITSNKGLYFSSDGDFSFGNYAGTENYLQWGATAGQLDLLYGNSSQGHTNAIKLSTKSYGIDVSGDINVTGAASSIIFDPNNNNGKTFFIRGEGNGNATIENDDEMFVSSTHLYIQKPGGTTTMAEFIQDGAVKLNHNNSTKLQTHDYGIDVTGRVETDTLNVSGIATISQQLLINDFADTSSALGTKLYVNGPSVFQETVRVGVGGTIGDLLVSGKVGIGTTQATAKLDVDGTLNVSGISTFLDNIGISSGKSIQHIAEPEFNDNAHRAILSYGSTESTPAGTGGDFYREYAFHHNAGAGTTGTYYQRVNTNIDYEIGIDSDRKFAIGNHNVRPLNSDYTSFEVIQDGETKLYYNYNKKLETTGYGVTVTGGLNISGISTFQDDIEVTADDKKLIMGADRDLSVYHYSNTVGSFIDNKTEHLYIRTDIDGNNSGNIILRASMNQTGIVVHNSGGTENGKVELRYNDYKKLETTGYGVSVTDGLNVSGIATAQKFVGDGSELTNLPPAGSDLVTYASASNIANSAESISGISSYIQLDSLLSSQTAGAARPWRFGRSNAMSADASTLIVGAPEGSLNGSSDNTGLVHVFDREGNSYREVGIITAGAYADDGDNFGHSVACSTDGRRIVVGSYSDEPLGSTGGGLVHIFDRQGDTFTRVGALSGTYASPPFASSGDSFGYEVDCSGDGNVIVVGAKFDETGASASTGVVYVFDRSGNNFTEVGIITSSSNAASDIFGHSVSISEDGNTIVASAIGDGSNDEGIVYVFDRTGTNTFNEVGILTGGTYANQGAEFGNQVKISSNGKTIVVGCSSAEVDEAVAGTGLVHVFDRNPDNTFTRVGVLTGSHASQSSDGFGNHIDVSADGNTIAVGAEFDELTGGNPIYDDDGLGYIFTRQGDTFEEVSTFIQGRVPTLSADGKTVAFGDPSYESGGNGAGRVLIFEQQRQTYLHSTSTGNIGIGVTNPTAKLDVDGSIAIKNHSIVSITTSHTASAGTPFTIDTFATSENDLAEYTMHVGYGTYIQAQKVLVMHNGTTAYAQESAIMYQPGKIVSISATISGGNVLLQATPKIGVSGITTYKIVRGGLV